MLMRTSYECGVWVPERRTGVLLGLQKFTCRVSGHNTALGRVRLHICFHSLLNQLIFDLHFSMRRPMDRDNS